MAGREEAPRDSQPSPAQPDANQLRLVAQTLADASPGG